MVKNPNARISVLVKSPKKNDQRPKYADFGFSQIPKKKWSKTQMHGFQFYSSPQEKVVKNPNARISVLVKSP
jgi:hypothetical protein